MATGAIGPQRPYVVCQVGEAKTSSSVCSGSMQLPINFISAAESGKNPIWNETFQFNVEFERTAFLTVTVVNNLHLMCFLKICHKKWVTSDNVIGTVELDLDKVCAVVVCCVMWGVCRCYWKGTTESVYRF